MSASLGIASAGTLGHQHGHTEPNIHTTKPLIELDVRIEGFLSFDKHQGFFRGGVLQGFGEQITIGESGYCKVQGTGFSDEHTFSIEEGSFIVRKFLLTDRQALQSALYHTGVTVDQFIQQIGNIALQHCAYEIISGTVIINGVQNNIVAGIYIISSAGVNSGKTYTGSGNGLGVGSGDLVQTITVTQTATVDTQMKCTLICS